MFGVNLTVGTSVTIGLCILGAVAASLVAWYFWDKHEYGKPEGAHARSFRGASQTVVPPCMEAGSYASAPEPPLVLSEAVLAATARKPWLIEDIRIERTRNLPGAGVHALSGEQVRRAGEPDALDRLAAAYKPPAEKTPNQRMSLWKERDSVISDQGLAVAIRSAVDPGWADRDLELYFSQIDLARIFANLGARYIPSGGAA